MSGRYFIYKGTDCNTCKLTSLQCTYIKKNGQQCKNRTVITAPFCWIHTMELFGVRVKESKRIPGQMGLFADKAFKKGQAICPYYGDIRTKAEIDRYYGISDDDVAPYAVQLRDGQSFVDAACYRSAGGNANDPRKGRRAAPESANAKFVDKTQDVNVAFPSDQDLKKGPFENIKGQYVLIQARKPIKKGDEITVSYGDDYKFSGKDKTTGYLRSEQKARDKYCD